MDILDNTVNHLLKKYVGGQKFFTAMDKSVQNPFILNELVSIIPENKVIIVSGHFGIYSETLLKNRKLLILPGNIRHTPEFSLVNYSDFIKHKDFVFIDDSYCSGRTRNYIQREIEKYKGNFIHTYVVYDGSIYKDKGITSLFRYHERF